MLGTGSLKKSSLSECAGCAHFGERRVQVLGGGGGGGVGGGGQFHAQVESQRGQLGNVALTPVTAAESRGELRRDHNVQTGASSG